MRRRQLPLLTGLAAGVALLLLTVILVLPKNAQAGRVADALEGERARLEAMEAERDGLEEYRASGRAGADLAAARALVPPTTAIADLITAVDRAATASGAALIGLSPETPSQGAVPGVSVIPVTVTATGPYFALTRFVFELEHLTRLMRIDAVSLSSGEVGGVITLTVTGSVYTTDGSAGPGGDPAPGPELGT